MKSYLQNVSCSTEMSDPMYKYVESSGILCPILQTTFLFPCVHSSVQCMPPSPTIHSFPLQLNKLSSGGAIVCYITKCPGWPHLNPNGQQYCGVDEERERWATTSLLHISNYDFLPFYVSQRVVLWSSLFWAGLFAIDRVTDEIKLRLAFDSPLVMKIKFCNFYFKMLL